MLKFCVNQGQALVGSHACVCVRVTYTMMLDVIRLIKRFCSATEIGYGQYKIIGSTCTTQQENKCGLPKTDGKKHSYHDIYWY